MTEYGVPAKRRGRSVSRYSSTSVAKLKSLGVDPIDYMVNTYDEITAEIEEQQKLKKYPVILADGSKRRYSAEMHARLLEIKQKIGNDLMRYGYARVPETIGLNSTEPKGLVINMVSDDNVFKIIEETVAEDEEDLFDD